MDQGDAMIMEQMKRLVQIDDNIEHIKCEMREYCKQGREQIRDLMKQRVQIRQDLGQLPLFGGQ